MEWQELAEAKHRQIAHDKAMHAALQAAEAAAATAASMLTPVVARQTEPKARRAGVSPATAAMVHASAGEEAARLAYEGQAEHEIEKLQREFQSAKSRMSLQLKQREADIARLEAVVADAQSLRRAARYDLAQSVSLALQTDLTSVSLFSPEQEPGHTGCREAIV